MLFKFVGPVDWNSAAVLIAIAVALCIMTTAAIVKRRSRLELQMQFDIDQHKLNNENLANDRLVRSQLERDLGKIALERDVQFKRIETGLIELKTNEG